MENRLLYIFLILISCENTHEPSKCESIICESLITYVDLQKTDSIESFIFKKNGRFDSILLHKYVKIRYKMFDKKSQYSNHGWSFQFDSCINSNFDYVFIFKNEDDYIVDSVSRIMVVWQSYGNDGICAISSYCRNGVVHTDSEGNVCLFNKNDIE